MLEAAPVQKPASLASGLSNRAAVRFSNSSTNRTGKVLDSEKTLPNERSFPAELVASATGRPFYSVVFAFGRRIQETGGTVAEGPGTEQGLDTERPEEMAEVGRVSIRARS